MNLSPIGILILDVSRLEHDELFRTGLNSLSDYRSRKVLSYHFRKDRNLSLGVGLVLDRLLQQYDLREKEMRYDEGENGKPCFTDKPELHFNLSHAGRYAAGVIGTQELGLDIEEIVVADEGVLERCCHPREAAWLRSLPSPQRNENFTRLWTLKESFIKAIGTGLDYPLTMLEVLTASGEITATPRTLGYTFYEFSFTGYRGALCIPGAIDIPSIALTGWDFSEKIEPNGLPNFTCSKS